MATAVAQKPSAPHQTKMKRPPLPSVQTNGIQAPHASQSSSTSSKRPPGFKQPPTPTVNGINGEVNALGPRLSNRRKESQKPGDIQGRPNRGGKGSQDGEKRAIKRMAEPYVKTQSSILKRYRNKPPSLIIHLHPTHFRFDTQDGSFSYNSPMRFVLEHLKSQTIPHDMMDELNVAGTRFYEGCLIVQVQDHRTNSSPSTTSVGSTEYNVNVPSSIHNYNPYLTPSPYAPYPKKTELNGGLDGSSGSAENDSTTQSKDKEPTKPNIFHVVLFPTPLSIHEEVVAHANTVDPRQNGRKQSTVVSRTPASATVPLTPLSATQSASVFVGPPAKKQKMIIGGNEIHAFESKIIHAMTGPLFLDPVEDIADAHGVLEMLTDPRFKEPYPVPKVKKRTVAELAADEAIAAQEQDFMLIMDERHTSGPTGSKAGSTDGDSGIPAFQPNFEQWQALRNIRAQRKERKAREAEEHAINLATAQANKLRQEQNERAAKQEMERRAAEVAQNQIHISNARQAQMNREAQAREMQRQALASGQNQLPHGHSHPMPNGVSRAQNSSPVVRNGTPNANSSPLVGNVPMNVTTSGQGVTASPARPTSAAQHVQSSGNAMKRQVSRQGAPSRTGTPQMNGTPGMSHPTPVLGQTSTLGVSQGSPPVGSNPTMNHNALASQHINGQSSNFSPEQQQQQLEQRRIQHMYAQRQQQQHQHMQHLAAQRMQNGSPNSHMSPEQRTSAHMQNLQHQAALNKQRQTTADYQQSLMMHHAAMGNGPMGHPNIPNGASPPQQHPQQGHPANRPAQVLTPQQKQAFHAHAQQLLHGLLNQLAPKYGNIANIPQDQKLMCEQRAQTAARDNMRKQLGLQHQRLREQQHHQQMQHMAALNNMNGMNGMNGQGIPGMMNGMGVQGMTDQQKHAMMQGMQQQMHQMPNIGGNGMHQMNGMMHNQHMNGGGMGGMS